MAGMSEQSRKFQAKRPNLQDFLDYSVQQYDGLGRVLSRALKSPLPPKTKR